MNFEFGDLVLCVVERIENTIVFVKVLADGKELDGSIVISEIAPGRIRNLRDYVVPKKKIVCKVIRTSGTGNFELSLRRVSPKERKEVMERYDQERAYISIVKKAVGEKFDEAIKEMQKEVSLFDFLQEAKKNPKPLEKIVDKVAAGKILEILGAQKQKKIVMKREIILRSDLPNGLKMTKNIFEMMEGVVIKYIAAGKYSISAESVDIKKADEKIRETIAKIEKMAKEGKMEFSIAEK